MIYLSNFTLMSENDEEQYLNYLKRTCYDSYYPLQFFPQIKQLEKLQFSDITILCGGNGSGKSTLLNIIAEKLQLSRNTPFNKTAFFDPYLEYCTHTLHINDPIAMRDFMAVSRIITSDDVFNHIIEVRKRNNNLNFKRDLILDEKDNIKKYGWQGERNFSTNDMGSLNSFINKNHMSASKYVRNFVGVDERTYSNGENGFRYFTDAIQPGGLYLLDEPENSLSAEMQLELVQFIVGMARHYNCQFILSSHSPFLLSMPYARIYNMDVAPVSTCRWTDLPNIRIFHEFFKDHEHEFDEN